ILDLAQGDTRRRELLGPRPREDGPRRPRDASLDRFERLSTPLEVEQSATDESPGTRDEVGDVEHAACVESVAVLGRRELVVRRTDDAARPESHEREIVDQPADGVRREDVARRRDLLAERDGFDAEFALDARESLRVEVA